MITPEIPPHTPIVTPSEHVQGWLDLSHQTLAADGVALAALANHLRVALPEKPRLRIYANDDWRDMEQAREVRAHPEASTNDLHILLSERRLASDENELLTGTAAALLYHQHAASRQLRRRVGGGLIAAGATLSGVGRYEQMNGRHWGTYIALTGTTMAVAGAAVIAPGTNRRWRPQIPALEGAAPPIRVSAG